MEDLNVTTERGLEARPLIVDLDGTLTTADLSIESIVFLLATKPLRALRSLPALAQGKAAFKARVAAETSHDTHELPFNQELLAFIRAEKTKGRRIYLASASDRSLVEAAVRPLGLFDGVFASDGRTNLSGAAKAAALCDAFGEGGFDYAGNAREDMEVWQKAHGVLVVGATPAFLRAAQARFPHARGLDGRVHRIADYVTELRTHQWLKNLLVFVPALAAHRFVLPELLTLVLAFLSFSACASSAYLANDLFDLRNDRAHPTKRRRPLASGRLPLLHGAWLIAALLVAAFALALPLSWRFEGLLAAYYALTLAYSAWLKRKMMIDVVTLAGLYAMRLAAGSVAVDVPLSAWLVVFAIFFFLSLALVKRCSEIINGAAKDRGDPAGRGYVRRDLPVLEAMAVGTAHVALVVFALYINSATVDVLYRRPIYLWFICVVLFYWISRILLLTHRGDMHDDPVVFAATDWTSLGCGGLILLLALAAI